MALQYIYNDDGTQALMSVRPGYVKGDLEKWIDQVLDAPVQVYVGNTAHPDICWHNTKAGESFGSREGLKFSAPFLLIAKAMEELHGQGTDYLRVLAERAHVRGKKFLAGIRMSDAHHSNTGNVKPHEYPLFPKFALDHPEFRIRKPDGTMDVTLDYSFDEVRAYRLAIMKEIISDYPVDGLELDFMRFCSHFPRPATDRQIGIMNDFIKSIRKMMDEEMARKGCSGRPVLGVRVPPSLAECSPNGLDPEYWIEEGLIDYLTPANFLWADFNIPLTDYLVLSRNTDCKVFFSIQPWWAAPWGGTGVYHKAFPMQLPEFRALAANGIAAGADGLHYFNLCCEYPGRKDEMYEAMVAMATPEAIYSGPRHYQYFPLDFDETPTGCRDFQSLRFSELNKPQIFKFQMADGIRKEHIKGRMAWRIYNAAPTDQWNFRLNNYRLASEQILTRTQYAGYPIRVGAELPAHIYFEIDLENIPALQFNNQLEITPLHLEEELTAERYMEVLEVWTE